MYISFVSHLHINSLIPESIMACHGKNHFIYKINRNLLLTYKNYQNVDEFYISFLLYIVQYSSLV